MYLCSYVFKNQRTKAFYRLIFRHMSIRTTISIITFAPQGDQNGKKHVK